MERLKNYKTLSYPEIDRKRGFDEIVNSPIYKNYVITKMARPQNCGLFKKR